MSQTKSEISMPLHKAMNGRCSTARTKSQVDAVCMLRLSGFESKGQKTGGQGQVCDGSQLRRKPSLNGRQQFLMLSQGKARRQDTSPLKVPGPNLSQVGLANGFQAIPRHFVYLLTLHQPNTFPQARYKTSQPTLAVCLLLFIVTVIHFISNTSPRSQTECVLGCCSV